MLLLLNNLQNSCIRQNKQNSISWFNSQILIGDTTRKIGLCDYRGNHCLLQNRLFQPVRKCNSISHTWHHFFTITDLNLSFVWRFLLVSECSQFKFKVVKRIGQTCYDKKDKIWVKMCERMNMFTVYDSNFISWCSSLDKISGFWI